AGQSFLDRWTRLSTTYGLFQANVTLVQQNLVRCWASLFNAFQAYVAGGYEGAMLRNPSAGYQSGRTTALLKWKTDQLVDAKVIGLTVGVGKFEGILGSIECALPSGTKFSVGSGWMDEERKHIWTNQSDYIGRGATIKYMTLSNDGVPKMSTFIKWI